MKAWNRFFFEPISPASISLFRIAFGIVVLLSIVGRFPSRDIFYGAEAIVSYESMDRFFPGSPWFFFRWIPLHEPWLGIYFGALIVAILSLTVGFCTRISSILVFLGLISLCNRNFFVDNAGDDLLRINAFFLMFTHAGAAYSVDRWIRRKKGREGKKLPKLPPWGQRILQLQLAYLYFETALLKTQGVSWLDGSALYYALNYLELRRFDLRLLFAHLWQIKIASFATMFIEVAGFSFIWFRKFRYPVLITAALLHLSINLMMQFPVFQYAMIASLINFIYPEDVEKSAMRLRTLMARKRIAAWIERSSGLISRSGGP